MEKSTQGHNSNRVAQKLIVSAGGMPVSVWHYACTASEPIYNVLFIHGYLDVGRSFEDVIFNLPSHINCYAIDLRGHGETDLPQGASAHLLDYVKDVTWLLQHFTSTGHPIDALIGHSMGGNIALMIAGALPTCVPRLMLIDTLGPPPEEAENQAARLEDVLMSMLKPKSFHSYRSKEAATTALLTNNPYLSKQAAERMIQYSLKKVDDDKYEFAFNPAIRGPTPIRYSENAWRVFCERIQAKTFCIRAEFGYVPLEGEYFSRLSMFKNMTLFEVKGAGHHLHVEEPHEIARLIMRLLEH